MIQILVITTNLSKFFIVDGIKIQSILIVVGVCLITFIIGELIKPVYVKFFKDYM